MQPVEVLALLSSTMISFLFFWMHEAIPFELREYIITIFRKLRSIIYPYDQIIINEYSGRNMTRDELYTAVDAYLSSTCSSRAHKLKAEVSKDSDRPLVTIDEHEEVMDIFQDFKIWWFASKRRPNTTTIKLFSGDEDPKFYVLTFHKRHRKKVEDVYLSHVLKEGRLFRANNRQRRLFTNNPSSNWYGHDKAVWTHVPFKHPATFKTLAMDPIRKEEIEDDLVSFREGKDYYEQIGKAWKRGYLLYGPPGTGKSTMIATMANFLDYDVYDLELTAVKSNTELRKLFIETTGKSIIVIEDIDCSLDLTGKRKDKKKKESDQNNKEIKTALGMEEKDEESKITLSGLLNFIDGLWSACGGERIIVFTTNHFEKLDPALIRPGRMDMRIEMSFCNFEAFKVLAKNYLGVEEHSLFLTIREMLETVNVAPAAVAEGLMRKKSREEDVDSCLQNLINNVLKRVKEEGKKVIEEERAENAHKEDDKN
ncbi:hypothetical protein LUZ60_005189 [Juncus effusus]|nr:hypothetical protein LUZ60_005189 [Juncus effusus]